MDNIFVMLGRIAGIAGLLVCLAAGVTRLLGHFSLMGYSVAALLQAGMAGLLVGCFALLLAHHERR